MNTNPLSSRSSDQSEGFSIDKQGSFVCTSFPKYQIGPECTRLYERLDPLMSHMNGEGMKDAKVEQFGQLLIKLEQFLNTYVKSDDSHAKIIYFKERKNYLHDFTALNTEIRTFYDLLSLDYSIEQFRNEDLADQRQAYKTAFFALLNQLSAEELSSKSKRQQLLTELDLYPVTVATFLASNKYLPLSVKEKQLLGNDLQQYRDCLQLTFQPSLNEFSSSSLEMDDFDDDVSSISTVNEITTSAVKNLKPMTPRTKKQEKMLEKLRVEHFLHAKIAHKLVQIDKEINDTVSIGTFHRRHMVMLKQYPLAILQDNRNREAIEQEVLLLKSFGSSQYPTILTCYGFTVKDPSFFIVYALAPYGTLDVVLRESQVNSFPLSLKLAWMNDLADALQFLHSKKVLHGDVRTANVSVFDRLETKLGNFEQAKYLLSSSPTSSESEEEEDNNNIGIKLEGDEGEAGGGNPVVSQQVLHLPLILRQVESSPEVDHYSFVQYTLQLLLAASTSNNYKIPEHLPAKQQVKQVLAKLQSTTKTDTPLLAELEQTLLAILSNQKDSAAIAVTTQDLLTIHCQGDPRHYLHHEYRDIQIIESLLPSLNASPQAESVQQSVKERASRLSSSRSVDSLDSTSSTISSVSSTGGLSLDFLRYSIDQSLQEAENRFKFADYLRTQVGLAHTVAMETAGVLMKNGVSSVRQLQSKLFPSASNTMVATTTATTRPISNKDKAKSILQGVTSPTHYSLHAMIHSPSSEDSPSPNHSLSTNGIAGLVENWEFLIDLGLAPEVALDIYERFLSLRKHQKPADSKKKEAAAAVVEFPPPPTLTPPRHRGPLMPTTSFDSPGSVVSDVSSVVSLGSRLGSKKQVLPSEIARLYASASLSGKLSSFEKLQTLAEDEDVEYHYYLARGFLMRMYCLGQGPVRKDRSRAQQLAEDILPWLQDRVLLEYETARMYLQYFLGVCYSEGLGDLPADPQEAIRWYRASAEGAGNERDGGHHKGYSAAQAYLGHCYFHGIGVTRDYSLAVKYYHLAAEAGHAGAQTNLGICYEKGLGVAAADRNMAAYWFRLSAAQNDAGGLFNLAYYYSLGCGEVELSPQKAYEHYLKAATLHRHVVAEFEVGNCFFEGIGVEQSFPDAIQWFRIAAEKDYPLAMTKLGLCYEQGIGVEQDYTQAVGWYHRAIEFDPTDKLATYYLGFCYFNGWGVAEKDEVKAAQYYQISARQGHPPAQNNLGYCYFHGYGVKKNVILAARYYQQSAEAGYAPAQYNLGYCYERGLGLPKKLNLMIRYYRLAAEQGNQHAKQALLKHSF